MGNWPHIWICGWLDSNIMGLQEDLMGGNPSPQPQQQGGQGLEQFRKMDDGSPIFDFMATFIELADKHGVADNMFNSTPEDKLDTVSTTPLEQQLPPDEIKLLVDKFQALPPDQQSMLMDAVQKEDPRLAGRIQAAIQFVGGKRALGG